MVNFKNVLEDLIQLNIGDILEFEPMYKHTTFKVGGPARLYIEVSSIDGLKKLVNYIKVNLIDFHIIGKGSNVLFSDKEFEGIIISLNKYFNDIHINGTQIKAMAGTSVIKLAQVAMKHELTGLEFISGIPATVGGCIYMNAGAYKSDISKVCTSVTILDSELNVIELNNNEMEFDYRHSILQNHNDWIVLEATFNLEVGDKEKIKQLMDTRKQKRMATQPWDRPSCGSVFRNPESKGAWQYIDGCNLRGYSIGHAKVSTKHSNFIINTGYASAKDIKELIEYIQITVKNEFNVDLYTEVRFMNWD